jgi:thymidylate synthase
MKPICESTCERAWLAAAEHLADAPSQTEYNLVIEIEKPTIHDAADHRVRQVVEDFLVTRGSSPLATVAGTIFPAAEYRDHGARGVYELYPTEVYPNIRSGSGDWGRYAYRLVRWKTPEGETINPLEIVVEKIKRQLNNGRRMRQCYELSLTESGIDLPLYDPTEDAAPTRNRPCLSHISLKIGATDILYLTALYRSHTYVARALGNFIGLAALQAFVCVETGLEPGPLVCLSTYARLERGEKKAWTTGDAQKMVENARAAFDQEAL